MLIATSPIKNEQCTAKFFSGLSETARIFKRCQRRSCSNNLGSKLEHRSMDPNKKIRKETYTKLGTLHKFLNASTEEQQNVLNQNYIDKFSML
jgi:hypothetical protein